MVVTEVQKGWVTHPRSHSESAPVLGPRLHDAMCTRIVSDVSSGLAAVLVLPYNRTSNNLAVASVGETFAVLTLQMRNQSLGDSRSCPPPQITELGDGPEPGF